jgi:hypothetical protein
MTVSDKEKLIADLRLAAERVGKGPIYNRLNNWITILYKEVNDENQD